MKHVIRVIVYLFVIVLSIHITYIKANDDESLDLETESLHNKTDDYSSLTDINGLNLFTDDIKKIIEKQEQQ